MRMRIESNRVTLLQLEESRPPPPSLFLSFNLLTAQLSIVSLSAEEARRAGGNLSVAVGAQVRQS